MWDTSVRQMRDMTHSCVWHDACTCVTCRCASTHTRILMHIHNYNWYARLIHVCDMTHSCVWHDSFMCGIWREGGGRLVRFRWFCPSFFQNHKAQILHSFTRDRHPHVNLRKNYSKPPWFDVLQRPQASTRNPFYAILKYKMMIKSCFYEAKEKIPDRKSVV